MDHDDDAFLYGDDSASAPVAPSTSAPANADSKDVSIAPTLPEANVETVKEVGASAEQAAGACYWIQGTVLMVRRSGQADGD